VAVAGWQCREWIREPSAVILSGDKFEIRAYWGSGMCGDFLCFARAPELCVGMWAYEAMAGGSVGGSGWVAVGPMDRGAQCGHFEW
jgi:hypothetical protein